MAQAMKLVLAGVLAGALGACMRREPPSPDLAPSVAPAEGAPAAATARSAGTASASGSATASGAVTASAPGTASATAPGGAAATASADPASLPQTHDKPAASGAAFDARVHALWEAIAVDDPDRAMPFFFPLGAYQQVKDIGDPASDWKRRLVAAYKRDIHALHARLGVDAPHATLVGLDLPDARARWVDPGEEYNKIGYYRVFGSKLRYEVDGQARSFDVKSLISWRGEWYVVHLSAIQ
jgi:hypothetical protein